MADSFPRLRQSSCRECCRGNFVLIFQPHHQALVFRVSHDDGGKSVDPPAVVAHLTTEQFVNHPSIAVGATLVAEQPTFALEPGLRTTNVPAAPTFTTP